MLCKISLFLIILYIITLIYFIIHIFCICHNTDSKNVVENIETPTNQIFKPKNYIKVWTFWEGKSSKIVDLCLKSITNSCEKANKFSSNTGKTFKHVHLTKDNLDKYVKNIKNHICYSDDEKTISSDLIRLTLLKNYGGFWLDASILVLTPIFEIFEKTHNYNNFYAVYNPQNGHKQYIYPVVENSMLYAPPNHPLINDWLEGMNYLKKCDKWSRINYTLEKPFFWDLKNLVPSYHYSYYVFRHILHNAGGIQNYNNITLISDIKIKYLAFLHFKDEDLLLLPLAKFLHKYNLKNTTSIKICSFQRKYIDNMIENKNYHPKSILLQI